MDSLLLLTSFLGLAGSMVLIVVGALQLRKAKKVLLPKISTMISSKSKTEEPKQSLLDLLQRTDERLEGKES